MGVFSSRLLEIDPGADRPELLGDPTPEPHIDDVQDVATDKLRSYVERLCSLKESRDSAVADFNADIKDVLSEADSDGFPRKAINILVRRRMHPEDKEFQDLADLYQARLDLSSDPTPDRNR